MTNGPQSGGDDSRDDVAIGIDLGGTNIKVAVVDHGARILAHSERPTRAERGPDAVIDDIVEMVDSLLHERGAKHVASSGATSPGTVRGIGVGAPGPLSIGDGRIINMANLPDWKDVPLRDRLAARLNLPVSLDNDGNAAALGEYWARRIEAKNDVAPPASRGDLVLLTLGTGVGAGIVIGGRILHGHFGNAGEIGHMIVERDGEPCPCGQRGCLERYASARQVVRRVERAVVAGEACALDDEFASGRDITASRVAECARDGDPLCARVWNDACAFLALACVNIQHVINPARIVLGGGMCAAGALLVDAVDSQFRAMTWKLYNDRPAIELSRLGTDAGVIGAAALSGAFRMANG